MKIIAIFRADHRCFRYIYLASGSGCQNNKESPWNSFNPTVSGLKMMIIDFPLGVAMLFFGEVLALANMPPCSFASADLFFFDVGNTIFQWDLRNGSLPHFRGPWERDSRKKSFRDSANQFDQLTRGAVYVADLGWSKCFFWV